MDWDAFSVQLENHENREISTYPKYAKNGFFAYKKIYFYSLMYEDEIFTEQC